MDLLAGTVDLNVSTGEFHNSCVVAVRQSQSERVRILSRLHDIRNVRLVGAADSVDLTSTFDVAKRPIHDDVPGDAGTFDLHSGAMIDVLQVTPTTIPAGHSEVRPRSITPRIDPSAAGDKVSRGIANGLAETFHVGMRRCDDHVCDT